MKRQAFSLCKLSTARIQVLRQALGGFIAARFEDRELALELLDDGHGRFCDGPILAALKYRPDRSRATAGGSLLRQYGRLSDGAPLWFHEASSGPGRAGPQPPENPVQHPPVVNARPPVACSAEQVQSQTTRKIRQIKPCHRKAPLRSLNHGSSELGTRYGNVT